MHDVLAPDIYYWQLADHIFLSLVESYGYQYIKFPIVEFTDLFKRGVGEVTDVVEKELYAFEDRSGDNLSLRPEGTAGCVRAGINAGLFRGGVSRLWYDGPMFRHERPQRGRARQFHQYGLEAFGAATPDIDVEIITISARFLAELQIFEDVKLVINSLGSFEDRKNYREKLVSYFTDNEHLLDEDSKRRLNTNPLRILDSKNPDLAELIQYAPNLNDHLSKESKDHFAHVQKMLKVLEIPFEVNPRLVRGLDYYCHTVFEWQTDKLGAQNAVGAGGRYDGLVEQLGGASTPAVGFSMGIERIVELMKERMQPENFVPRPDIYVMSTEKTAQIALFEIEKIRDKYDFVEIINNVGGGSFKAQLKRADKCGAQYAFIFGEDEVKDYSVAIKPLVGEDNEQIVLGFDKIMQFMEDKFGR